MLLAGRIGSLTLGAPDRASSILATSLISCAARVTGASPVCDGFDETHKNTAVPDGTGASLVRCGGRAAMGGAGYHDNLGLLRGLDKLQRPCMANAFSSEHVLPTNRNEWCMAIFLRAGSPGNRCEKSSTHRIVRPTPRWNPNPHPLSTTEPPQKPTMNNMHRQLQTQLSGLRRMKTVAAERLSPL